MRTLGGFCLALLFSTGLVAQNRSGFVTPLPGSVGVGSVVHPGGTSNMPGVQRSVGSVVHPGGSSPQIGIPAFGPRQFGNRGLRNNGAAIWAYPVPVYVGGYDPLYWNGYGAPVTAPPAQQQTPPNVIVVYPPPQAAPPIYSYQPPVEPAVSAVPPAQMQPEPQQEPTHYLLAFKDHSIYSAVAYWVDGDTLHYITAGNTHNQISVSLVDRDLTQRLNDGTGMEVKLPPAK